MNQLAANPVDFIKRLFFFVINFILFAIYLLAEDYILQSYCLFTILILFILLPFFIEKKRELYNPIFMLSIFYFIVFGIGVLSVLYFEPDIEYSPNQNYLLKTQLYSIICWVSFLIGYYVLFNKGLLKSIFKKLFEILPSVNKYEIDGQKYFSFIIFLFFVGWICRALLFSQGLYFHIFDVENIQVASWFAPIRQPVTILSNLPYVVLIVSLYQALINKNRKFRILFVISILIEIGYGLPSGSKEKLLIPVAFSIVAYSIFKRTPRAFLIAGSLIGIFFVFPFSIFYKNLDEPDITLAFFYYLNFFETIDPFMMEEIFVSVFGVRLNYVSIVMEVIKYVPSKYDFLYGSTYYDFFLLAIPRIIWPGKPATFNFNEFGRNFGFTQPNDYITSVTPTWIGETFLNFGWLGFLIPLLLGVFYKQLYLYFFNKQKPNMLYSILYIFIFYSILRTDILSSQFVGLIQLLLVLVIVFIPFIKKYLKPSFVSLTHSK